LQRLHQPHRRRRAAATVVVDHDIHGRPDDIAEPPDAIGEGRVQFRLGQRGIPGPCACLNCGKAIRDITARVLLEEVRVVDADMGIEADALARRAAEQAIDRHVPRLAPDVPERLIEGGQRGVEYHATAPEAVPINRLPVMLHREGVLADERLPDLLDSGAHGRFPAFQRRLAPAVDAPIGDNLHEDPVAGLAPRRVCPQLGDLHRHALSFSPHSARFRLAQTVRSPPRACNTQRLASTSTARNGCRSSSTRPDTAVPSRVCSFCSDVQCSCGGERDAGEGKQ
jgi:hypothetical protein